MTVNTWPTAAIVLVCKRFAEMSDGEQAEHLTYEHGFDGEYMEQVNDLAAVGVHLGNNREAREHLHSDDHAEYPYGGTVNKPHVHRKSDKEN